MAVFIDPVEVTPETVTGTWQDIDVSSYVPVGATGVILQVVNSEPTDDILYGKCGFRMNYSTDNRIAELWKGGYPDFYPGHIFASVGVDERIFEASLELKEIWDEGLEEYIYVNYIEVWLLGYYTDDAVFFMNCPNKEPGTAGSYIDVDISSDTGGDTAIGAIFEVFSPSGCYSYSIRNNGSTDDRRGSTGGREAGYFWVGVDENEVCEMRISTTNIDGMFLMGYIVSDHTFLINATNYSIGTADVWTDLVALPAGGGIGYFEFNASARWGVRKKGWSLDHYYNTANGKIMGVADTDSNRIAQAKVSNTGYTIYLQGYSMGAIIQVLDARGRIKILGEIKQLQALGRIVKTAGKQISFQARIQALLSKLLTARARLESPEQTVQLTLRATIVSVGKVILYAPADGSEQDVPVSFEWYIPSNRWEAKTNFHFQVDKTDNSFGDLEVEKKSWIDLGMEYWNNSNWVAIPVGGIDAAYAGNKARYSTVLGTGTKYWRVRAFAG